MALRLITSVFLLPPWSGFDEPFHHGYVEANAERLRWPRFREIGLPMPLLQAIRRWPLPSSYAAGFSAREYGQTATPPITAFRDTNHETQQSPLYYWATGLFLRILPHASPLGELYLLRLINAALAFSIGVLVWNVAAPTRFAWVPVALLALIPGFGIGMCRVANDAFCAALISAAVVGSLSTGPRRWSVTLASLAGGMAPWAKLYGLAPLPSFAVREALRKETKIRTRVLRVSLIVTPSLALTLCSLRFLGHPFPVMYNIRGVPPAALFDVPWLRDAWAVVKSHIWMSGMSFLVFPTWVYIVPVLLLGWGLFLTISAIPVSDRMTLVLLACPVGLFALALAYHDWRAFSFYRGGGGTGGWYLWAVALPETLLLTHGARKKGMFRVWILPVLAVFLVLTALADVALFLDSTGVLIRTPRNHVVGVIRTPVGQIVSAYLGSRPPAAAFAAAIFSIGSWLLAAILLATGPRRQRNAGFRTRSPWSGEAYDGGPSSRGDRMH